MRPETSLSRNKAAVDRELERLLPGRGSAVAEAMRYAVFPAGKRFRPLLVMAAGACFGASRRVLLPFAGALELIHSYSLVHDDLPAMDNDDLRRGRPSCHKAFGEGAALLAGDGLLTLAFEVMAAAPVPAALLPAKLTVMAVVGRAAGVAGMIGGQWLDISVPADKLDRRTRDVINAKKTGALIRAAIDTGAILGLAGPAGRRAIAACGRNLGLAFQVRDDILDAAGDAARGRSARVGHPAEPGLDGDRARLEKLVAAAVRALDGFGERAAELRLLARSVLDPGAGVMHA